MRFFFVFENECVCIYFVSYLVTYCYIRRIVSWLFAIFRLNICTKKSVGLKMNYRAAQTHIIRACIDYVNVLNWSEWNKVKKARLLILEMNNEQWTSWGRRGSDFRHRPLCNSCVYFHNNKPNRGVFGEFSFIFLHFWCACRIFFCEKKHKKIAMII